MRVLLAGGGSGGSAAPVIAVAEALSCRCADAHFLYLGTATGPEGILAAAAGLPFATIHAGRLRRFATWRNLSDPALVVAGFVQALAIVRRFRPHAAIGAGGFATVPPLLAARAYGVPVFVHQQDVTLGLANRMVAPFATTVTVAFSATRLGRRKADVIGNPVRSGILSGDGPRGRARLGLDAGRPMVLITGGGTGALRLNEVAAQAAARLVGRCQFVQLTGTGKDMPGPDHPDYHQHAFLTEEMGDALAAADVVVSRAGMSTLGELAALRKPTILVPMRGSHQEANASAFAQHGAAIVLDEESLTESSLVAEIDGLLAAAERREALGARAAELLPPGAADALATLVVERAPPQST